MLLCLFVCLFVFLFVCLFACLFQAVECSMFAYFQVADNNLCSFKSDSKLEPTCCSPPFRVDLYLHAVILSHRYNAILPHHNSKSGNPKHFREESKKIGKKSKKMGKKSKTTWFFCFIAICFILKLNVLGSKLGSLVVYGTRGTNLLGLSTNAFICILYKPT